VDVGDCVNRALIDHGPPPKENVTHPCENRNDHLRSIRMPGIVPGPS